jgi:peroxiredoxin
MRLLALLVLLRACAPVGADDSNSAVALALIELKIAYQNEASAPRFNPNNNSDKAAQRKLLDELYTLGAPYCQKALELAENNPRDPASFDALNWIVAGPFAYSKSASAIDSAFELLTIRYATDRRAGTICEQIGRHRLSSPAPLEFLRTAAERNPSHTIRGQAMLLQGDLLMEYARIARQLRSPAPSTEQNANDGIGPTLRSRLLGSPPDDFEALAAVPYQRALKEFADVKALGEQTIGEIARGRLFRLKELNVGKKVPNLDGHEINGKPMALNDYRGKIVVLIFWAGWWAPSLETAAKGDQLLKRFGDKRVAVVGVNGDSSPQAAEKVAEREKISWPNFFDGKRGRGLIATNWGISTWPTIFVIDAEGIIQHIGSDSAKLDEIIDDLLNKAK